MNGKISLICGPMYSGKTTEVLRRLERSHIAKKRVIMLRPYSDTRQFLSHSKLNISWLKYEFIKDLSNFDAIKYDVIGIDEGQFHKNLRNFCCEYVSLKKNIVISALHATSECEMFEQIIEVLPYCDEIIKLNAVCNDCGSDFGSFTYYKYGIKTEKILVGGDDKYISLCNKCYIGRRKDRGLKWL